MSRIGKMKIKLPEGVKLNVSEREVIVSGPKGTLSRILPKEVDVEVKDSEAIVAIKKKGSSALHGTYRALIANMVEGVTKGWNKTLELVGSGYRAEVAGNTLTLTVGFSHPVKIEAPEGVLIKVDKNLIVLEGIDKELVGQIAAKIRAVRPPEPYKGKGIKYKEEFIRRKPGKAARAQGMGVT